jgi:HSP20 family protein
MNRPYHFHGQAAFSLPIDILPFIMGQGMAKPSCSTHTAGRSSCAAGQPDAATQNMAKEKAQASPAQAASNETAKQSEHFIQPKADIIKGADSVSIIVELPGVSRQDIAVSFDPAGRMLTIQAKKKPADESLNYLRLEREFGTYKRRFRITDNLDENSIQAAFNEGILTLEFNRRADKELRTIEIK